MTCVVTNSIHTTLLDSWIAPLLFQQAFSAMYICSTYTYCIPIHQSKSSFTFSCFLGVFIMV